MSVVLLMLTVVLFLIQKYYLEKDGSHPDGQGFRMRMRSKIRA